MHTYVYKFVCLCVMCVCGGVLGVCLDHFSILMFEADLPLTVELTVCLGCLTSRLRGLICLPSAHNAGSMGVTITSDLSQQTHY